MITAQEIITNIKDGSACRVQINGVWYTPVEYRKDSDSFICRFDTPGPMFGAEIDVNTNRITAVHYTMRMASV